MQLCELKWPGPSVWYCRSWANYFSQIKLQSIRRWLVISETLPKAQRTRGLSDLDSLGHMINYYTNLDQISSSEYRPSINFQISTKLSKILTILQLQNLAWTSTSNSWPNLVLKVWTNKFTFMTKLQLPNLHQHVFLASTSKNLWWTLLISFDFTLKGPLDFCKVLIKWREYW